MRHERREISITGDNFKKIHGERALLFKTIAHENSKASQKTSQKDLPRKRLQMTKAKDYKRLQMTTDSCNVSGYCKKYHAA